MTYSIYATDQNGQNKLCGQTFTHREALKYMAQLRRQGFANVQAKKGDTLQAYFPAKEKKDA